MSTFQKKKRDALLWKKYFSENSKVKRVKNRWDSLPDDCREVIRTQQRMSSFAYRIQRHYRKVRYAPGTAPEFDTPHHEIDDGYGGLRTITNAQRVVVYWYPESNDKWLSGSVIIGKCHTNAGREFKYDAHLCCIPTPSPVDSYSYIWPYWYDPKKGNTLAMALEKAKELPSLKKHLVRNCVLIKPWDDMKK